MHQSIELLVTQIFGYLEVYKAHGVHDIWLFFRFSQDFYRDTVLTFLRISCVCLTIFFGLLEEKKIILFRKMIMIKGVCGAV